jgi:ABC-2 type transport system ATP-binding protein
VSSEITVERLTKRYGETLAVDDLSFTVEAGRVTGFLGPNGSGKSTTMRALLGLIRPTSGRALVQGRPFHELKNPVRTVGASLDARDVHPGRTGRSHLRTLSAAAGLPNSRVDEVLDMTELTPARDRRVKGYSMGMRQRLALAAALLGDPKILMLDEPANGLDPQGMRWLRDILVALASEGRAVLISSHVLSEVEQTVDSVVVIGVGRLVMQGTLQDLVAGDTRPALVRSPRMAELRTLLEDAGGSARREGRADTMLIHGMSLEEIGTLAADNGIPVFELTRATATLEDRFLELTGESGNVR